jgi:O-antigen ligase
MATLSEIVSVRNRALSAPSAILVVGVLIGVGLPVASARLGPTLPVVSVSTSLAAVVIWLIVRDLAYSVAVAFVALIPIPVSVGGPGLAITGGRLAAVALLLVIMLRPSSMGSYLRAARTSYGVIGAGLTLLVVALVVTLQASQQAVAFRELGNWIILGALAVLLVPTLSRPERLALTMWTLLIITDVICLDALISYLLQSQYDLITLLFNRPIPLSVGRTQGVFGSANVMGGYLAVVAPIAAAAALGINTTRRTKILGLISFALIELAALATLSRGGILAGLVGVFAGLLLYANRGGRWRILVWGSLVTLVIIVVATLLGFVEPFAERVPAAFVAGESQRPAYWSSLMGLWSGHELWGLGPGNLRLINPNLTGGLTVENASAHNTYLQILIEGGVVTFLAWLCFIVALMKRLRAAAGHLLSGDPSLAWLAGGLVGAWSAAATQGLFDYTYTTDPMLNLLAYLLAATIGAATVSFARDRPTIRTDH